MYEVKTIIFNTPLDIEATERTFKPIMARFSSFTEKWRDEKDAELLRILDPSYKLKHDRAKLDLVTSVFKCQ